MGARNFCNSLVPERDGEPELEPIAPGSYQSCTEKNFQYRDERARLVKNFRAISTGQLHALRRFHLRPINVVVYHDSSPLRD
jgi:hypothetical protein